MKILVLFDGAGLARLGLEEAGHECLGIELDPYKHYLGQFVGSGHCLLGDVLELVTPKLLSHFDAVWASPPCQERSSARTQGAPTSKYAENLLDWSLALDIPVLWVENVLVQTARENDWGTKYNAAQFLQSPIQNRNRVIGGHYEPPRTFAPYKKAFPGICPAITASEYKGCASDSRRASRYYGRRITVEEAAYHQGFEIPREWYALPEGFKGTPGEWKKNIYEAIGNGVPVYFARAFGECYQASPKRASATQEQLQAA